MTLLELMVSIGLGSLVLAMVGTLWLYGVRSFVALGNYADLDSKSRYGMDVMLRDMRQATRLVAFQRNGTDNWLQFTNADAPGTLLTYSWNSSSRQVLCQKTSQPDEIFLTDCDTWDFQTYQRTPLTNGTYAFYPATNMAGAYDPSICKLISLSWKCSRTVLSAKTQTESAQTAQVVLRNKQ